MNIFESVASAFLSVLANKLRSILTMLGIIIGLSSVITITSIGMGYAHQFKKDLEESGLDGMQVTMNSRKELINSDYLTIEDLEIVNSHPNVINSSPLITAGGSVALKTPEEAAPSDFFGVNDYYRHIRNIKLIHGRFLIEQDIKNKSAVVIIDENLSNKVFGRSNSVGEILKAKFWFGTHDFTVIGVSKADKLASFFGGQGICLVPFSTLSALHDIEIIDPIVFKIMDTKKVTKTATELNKMLEIAHGNKDKYKIEKTVQGLEDFYKSLAVTTAFVGIVAGISLFVGGVGVMNIMLVTVTERTREIGIRKSLGATSGNIKFQFLVEAVILTSIGGIFGIILGYIGSFALGTTINVSPIISIPTIIISVLISVGTGVIFGVYPAGKAARLDPIEALRYE